MKKIMILLAFIGLTTIACAQTGNQGVNFIEASMTELMALSTENEKPIFIDVYTTWCGPCKYMSNSVFSQEKAGDYFNAEFINAKFDAEKGEGIQVARKYQVNAYPTFLILDSTGKELARIVGGDEIDGFIKRVKEVAP